MDQRSSNLGKGQAPPAIEGFTPLVLALPVVVELATSLIQEGIAIFPTIQGFNPLILIKLASGISGYPTQRPLKPFCQVWWSLIQKRSL